jgi:hypothetical protein
MFKKILVILVALLLLTVSFATAVATDTVTDADTDIVTDVPFIVEEDLWEAAQTYKYVYPTGYEVWGVAFAEMPIGTIIYAPFDGYGLFSFYQMGDESVGNIEILLSSDKRNWSGEPDDLFPDEKIFFFTLEDCSLLAKPSSGNWNFTVKKGEPMVQVEKNGEVQEGVRLFIEPYLKEPNQEGQDPKGYLSELLAVE